MKNGIDELFEKEDKEFEELQKRLTRAIDEKNFDEIKRIVGNGKIYQKESEIAHAIKLYTSNDISNELVNNKILNLVRNNTILDVKQTDSTITFLTEDVDIEFQPLSYYLKDIYRDYNMCYYNLRVGNCHEKSLDIARCLKQNENKNEGYKTAEVVTGYAHHLIEKLKYLHSWVEVEIDEKQYVMDYTMNVLMNKEGYYYLKHPDVLNRLNTDQIEKGDFYTKNINAGIGTSVKEDVMFYDEIAKELEKNKQIFKDSEQER